MGNCCRAESPCSSVEERCVLLNNDAKAAASVVEATVEGRCGPEDEDVRKVQDGSTIEKVEEERGKLISEKDASLVRTSKTQENGLVMKDSIQSAAASLCKDMEPNKNLVHDVKEPPEQPDLLQCTLDSPEKTTQDLLEALTGTNTVPEEADPDPAPGPDHRPPQTEATSGDQNVSSHPDRGGEEVLDACTVSSEGLTGEELSVPNSNLTTADVQVISKHLVHVEEGSSCAGTPDLDAVSLSLGGENTKVRDVSGSSPGPESTLGQSPGRERDAEEPEMDSSVQESVTTRPLGGSERSTEDQNIEPTKDFTSSENLEPEDQVRRTVPQVGGADGVSSEMVEDNVTEEEEELQRVEGVNTEAETLVQKDTDLYQGTGEEESSSDTDLRVELQAVPQEENLVPGVPLEDSEEDLYRAAEELSELQQDKPAPRPLLENSLVKVEDRCSLAPAVDVLSYSEREWRGNTAKSALIRKGYEEMSHSFGGVRRVRGDNYCALRATLFQVLSHSTELPLWLQEEDGTTLLKQLEAEEDLMSQWTLPGENLHLHGTEDVSRQLSNCVELLRNKWRAAVDSSSSVERRQLCERVFQGDEELGLLEALKLLMLVRAVELHRRMRGGGDVPLFCWLLFARDTSVCPRSFLCNHLSRVGLTAGLEQVEMFLLGYALQCTIQVYRLYKVDTEEFLTYYPDDHRDDWPSVCLVTEDDRHYNVPVTVSFSSSSDAVAGLELKVETS